MEMAQRSSARADSDVVDIEIVHVLIGNAVEADAVGSGGAPATVNAVETTTDGQVTISWSQVTTDENGNAINPAKVTYDVYIYDGQVKFSAAPGAGALKVLITVSPRRSSTLSIAESALPARVLEGAFMAMVAEYAPR